MKIRSSIGAVLAAVLIAPCGLAADNLAHGDKAPGFKATNVDGKVIGLDDYKDAKAVVVCFTCTQCPIASGYEARFIEFSKKYGKRGVQFVAINVNTGEDLEAMKHRAEQKGIEFPFAYDASGDSCRAFGAKSTPHLFLLDEDRKVAYQGAFDDDWRKPTKSYLQDAVDAVLAGKKPEITSTKPSGCSIRPAS